MKPTQAPSGLALPLCRREIEKGLRGGGPWGIAGPAKAQRSSGTPDSHTPPYKSPAGHA
jgi:hypothetical protein